MDSYKIEFRLGLIKIQSLDYSNNLNTRIVYSLMIIVDKGLKYKDNKVKDIKINIWRCKEQENKMQESKELKAKNKKLSKM
jgi:hypothetical protein